MNDIVIFPLMVIALCTIVITWSQQEQASYAKKTYELMVKIEKDGIE